MFFNRVVEDRGLMVVRYQVVGEHRLRVFDNGVLKNMLRVV